MSPRTGGRRIERAATASPATSAAARRRRRRPPGRRPQDRPALAQRRIPYPNNRAALADLLGADEADLWPDAGGPLAARARPEELGAVYPHRWAVPREAWTRFFDSAEHEIGILAYSALFLAEDTGILRILADKGRLGVTVRIALGDPDSPHVADRGEEEGIGDAMAAKIRNALALYRPLLRPENVQIRLHQTVLYNSIYRADDQLLVNQHAYGIPAAHAPVFCLRDRERRHGRRLP